VKRYAVQYARSARKELESLPSSVQDRILKAVDDLRINSRPRGSKKLKAAVDTYRIRVGDYRVVYEIEEEELIVLIVRVRHRKDVY